MRIKKRVKKEYEMTTQEKKEYWESKWKIEEYRMRIGLIIGIIGGILLLINGIVAINLNFTAWFGITTITMGVFAIIDGTLGIKQKSDALLYSLFLFMIGAFTIIETSIWALISFEILSIYFILASVPVIIGAIIGMSWNLRVNVTIIALSISSCPLAISIFIFMSAQWDLELFNRYLMHGVYLLIIGMVLMILVYACFYFNKGNDEMSRYYREETDKLQIEQTKLKNDIHSLNNTCIWMNKKAWEIINVKIAEVVRKKFSDGYYKEAVFDAMIKIDDMVKEIVTKLEIAPSDSGTTLMQRAFSPKNPIIKLADLTDKTGQDIQQGFMFLFAGAMLAIRDPKAHKIYQITPEEAFQLIVFVSLLANKIDKFSLYGPGVE